MLNAIVAICVNIFCIVLSDDYNDDEDYDYVINANKPESYIVYETSKHCLFDNQFMILIVNMSIKLLHN